ncbi:MAG: hypothetical protein JNM14_00495 [Ferruginibacter sp.]|nr:hypothetical protein [Ferruginibacter sp.]
MNKNYCYVIAVLLLASTYIACNNSSDKPADEELSQSGFTIRFMPRPPVDIDSNATPEQLASFAWEELFALNWKSSYPANGLRDSPDTTWDYTQPSPDLVVWETFGHRAELRPWSNVMMPFDKPPHYSYGITLKPLNPGDKLDLFNVLDENNEIGSCNMYAFSKSGGQPDPMNLVRYQAKVNRDEYEYIFNNFSDSAKLITARAKTLAHINKYKSYDSLGTPNSCDCKDKTVINLPCGGSTDPATQRIIIGAMEIKTAWRPLTSRDDASQFLTRTVVTFIPDSANPNTVYYTNKVYGLIGMHIIHKTRNNEDFVFATWEQVNAEKDSMGYVLLNNGLDSGTVHPAFPRLHPIASVTDSSTAYAHRLLRKKNPKSVLLNYRLVGVQAKPGNNTSAYSFFLANAVVESDSTLANFRGSGIGTPHNAKPNILYRNNNMISMGGCQGCHGVAQVALGTDLSFLLDNVGKPVFTPDILNQQAALAQRAAKIKVLIKATGR